MKRVLIIFSILAFSIIFSSCSKKQKNSVQGDKLESAEPVSKVSENEKSVTEEEIKVYDFSIPWEPAEDDNPNDPASAYQQVNTMDKAPEHMTEEYLVRNWQIDILSTGVDYVYFKFGRGGNFRVVSPFGGYLGFHGKYEIDGDKVILSAEALEGWTQLKDVFTAGNEIILEYDYNYKDYANVGVLKNDQIICRSGVEYTPTGTVCWMNDIEVEKIERIFIVPTDNMKLRARPDLKAKEKKYGYTNLFWFSYMEEAGEEYMLPNSDNEYSHYMNKDDCLLKGRIVSTTYKTTKQDTVDGVTAPWYLIGLTEYEEESWEQDYWVYGGFMETLGKEVNEKDRATYARILVDEGFKRQHLVLDEERIIQEKAKKMEPVIEEVADALYKKGGKFENNDLLQDSPVKIGMSQKELEEKYGKVPSHYISGNVYKYWGGLHYFEAEIENGVIVRLGAGYEK